MRAFIALIATAAASLALCSPALAGLGERLGPAVAIDRQEESGRVGFIGARPGDAIDSGAPSGASPEVAARRFVLDNERAFGLAGAADGLRVRESHAALARARTVRLQQTVDGIPVLGGELAVHVDPRGDILSVLGETSPSPRVATDPRVGAERATETARGAIAKAHGLRASDLEATEPRLRIYDPALLEAPDPVGEPRLAWALEVAAAEPPLREFVVIDAQQGSVALHFDQIAEARSQRVCDANNTTSEFPCTPAAADRSEPPDTGPVADADVNLAFEYAADTYDFFAQFGRDSLDDNGMTLVSTVDLCPTGEPCPYENAFWNGSQMAYGDGFASADDVVGHELSHGVTDFSSHLFYYQQSGAINESMSDVFGEFIDLTNGGGTDDAASRWLMGEDVPVNGAIRDMAHPPAFNDPDSTQSPLYRTDPGETDGGGVHSNSGVNNKAAFLITDGGAFNGQTVSGIGIAKAARIYYEVNNSMLVSASDYADLANALRQACANLAGTGEGGITTTDCSQVARAVAATRMDQSPANSPATEAPTPAETCTPQPAVSVFFDHLENTASGNWTAETANPPEYGGDAWFYPQNPNPYGFDATYATSGRTNLWGDDPGDGDGVLGPADPDVTDSAIAMTNPILIPPDAYLRFRHAYGFEDDLAADATYDGGVVEFSTGGGFWQDLGAWLSFNGYNGTISSAFANPLGGRAAFVRESNGYVSTLVDLAAMEGQEVRFRFRIGADEAVGDYGWFVDDIHVFACEPPPDLTPPRALLTGKPRKRTKQRRARFRFVADEPGVSFECSLKGRRAKRKLRKFRACASPRTYKRLKPGGYAFRLRPTDPVGNVGAVIKHRWKVKRRR